MLKDKTIFITGSSRGIGEAIAYEFAREKSRIILTYSSDSDAVGKVKEKCLKLGSSEVLVLELNLKVDSSIRDAGNSAIEKFGHIDYLINNAGVISWEGFSNESFEEIENQLRINLEGLIKMTSALLPQIKSGIINIASRAGHLPFAGRAVYTASKFGVIGFTKSLILEYPDLKIFSVSPGATKTQMWKFDNGEDPKIVGEYIIKALKNEVELVGGDINLWEII